MFMRTDAGLASERLFYDVDWIVYCEGVEQGEDVSSLDEVFWTKVLTDNGISCKCKSVGSKPELAHMTQKVLNGSADGVLVAMDRDYDHLNGAMHNHDRILYTEGYSWESDVCQEFSVRRVVQLFANIVHCDTIAAEFEIFKNASSHTLRRAFALDFKYHNHPESLFDRHKPLSIIQLSGPDAPYLRKSALVRTAQSLHKHQPLTLDRAYYISACGLRDFFGKTISRLVYHWFVKRTSRLVGKRSIPYDAAMMTMIDSMVMNADGSRRNQHYINIAAALAS